METVSMTAIHKLILALISTTDLFRRLYPLTQFVNYKLKLFPDILTTLKELETNGFIAVEETPQGNHYCSTAAAYDYCRSLDIAVLWNELNLLEDDLMDGLQEKVQQL